MKTLKKRVFEIIQIGSKDDLISRIFDLFIVAVIFISLSATFAATFDEMAGLEPVFNIIELISIIVFTVEYLLRVWTANLLYPKKSYIAAIFTYVFSFFGIIDLLTFVPFYLPFVFPAGAVAFRMFRVVRIFRLFKINAQYDAFNAITEVLYEKRNQIMSSIIIIIILLIASSLCMYSLEHDAQPDQFSNAFSGIWWSVSTMLTVGYGDIYPITIPGKLMAIVISFLGVGLVAIPTGIISAGFVEKYTNIRNASIHGTRLNLGTIVVKIDEEHRWAGKRISELELPGDVNLAAVYHDNELYPPYNSTVIEIGDQVVLTDCMQDWTLDFMLSGIDIKEGNEWIGHQIKDLDISRLERITLVRHGEKYIIPDGDYVIKNGDHVVVANRN